VFYVKQVRKLCCGVYFGTGAKCCVISGFRSNVDEICALLGYYVAYSGSCLPTFRDNLLVFLYL